MPGRGKIVNISSATVFTGRPNYLHYVTHKAALIGFTRALASEVGRGITVNAITPGSTGAEIERATITPEARRAMAAGTAMRRIQTPNDLTGAVLFLSSLGERLRDRSDDQRRRWLRLPLSLEPPVRSS